MKTKLGYLLSYLKSHPHVSAVQAKKMGISPVELKRWCDARKIYRLSRGYYGLETMSSAPEQVIALIPQPCAMSGITALIHYGYTNAIGNKVWVLVPEGYPPINRPDVETMRQIKKNYQTGLTKIKTKWGLIQITDREKTVIDALRGRYLDVEEKLRVLKRWMRDREHNRSAFSKYRNQIRLGRNYINWIMAIEAGV